MDDRVLMALGDGRDDQVHESDAALAARSAFGEHPVDLEGSLPVIAFVATGRNRASLSTITVQEILVRPFRTGASAVATAEGFLRHFADIDVVDVSYDIAREAARIRASTGLRTPHAIILATAFVTRVKTIVTNDRAWPAHVTSLGRDLRVCVLGDVPALTSMAGSLRDKLGRAPTDGSWRAPRAAASATPDPNRPVPPK